MCVYNLMLEWQQNTMIPTNTLHHGDALKRGRAGLHLRYAAVRARVKVIVTVIGQGRAVSTSQLSYGSDVDDDDNRRGHGDHGVDVDDDDGGHV